jgi:hypothetical protein
MLRSRASREAPLLQFHFFLFSFTFQQHRHAADKWADRAESALPIFSHANLHLHSRRIRWRP